MDGDPVLGGQLVLYNGGVLDFRSTYTGLPECGNNFFIRPKEEWTDHIASVYVHTGVLTR